MSKRAYVLVRLQPWSSFSLITLFPSVICSSIHARFQNICAHDDWPVRLWSQLMIIICPSNLWFVGFQKTTVWGWWQEHPGAYHFIRLVLNLKPGNLLDFLFGYGRCMCYRRRIRSLLDNNLSLFVLLCNSLNDLRTTPDHHILLKRRTLLVGAIVFQKQISCGVRARLLAFLLLETFYFLVTFG